MLKNIDEKSLKQPIKKHLLLSKSLSEKSLGSKRYGEARLKVAQILSQLKYITTDFLHKLSISIVILIKN